jgi:hypothetical protein
LAGVAFFPDLALAGATLRARLATLAFFVAFGCSAAPVACSGRFFLQSRSCGLLGGDYRVTTCITLFGGTSKRILEKKIAAGDGVAIAFILR